METRSGSSFGRSLFLIILFFSVLIAFGAITLLTVRAQSGGLSSMSVVYKDGMALERYIINSPPRPPASFNSASTLYKAPEPGVFSSSKTLSVPAYDWVYGCSSVSGAMISGYYDLNGYPNLYAGPANGGNAPMNNSASVWPGWLEGSTPYPNLPLAASHKGVDGRGAAVKGSIDDYWVSYGSTDNDPYTTGGWTQHSWNDGFAIGDYMKTSQKLWVDPGNPAIIINTDGSTTFYNYGTGSRYQCSQMALDGAPYSYDGSLGRKQFYEARGYTVTDCYNQVTDNKSASGFTYAQYKAEIDAGRPVMLNLYTESVGGHTVVGMGYEDPNTIIIHDTWIIGGDWVNVNHNMTWGGSYSGMLLSSVSIVNLAPLTPPAAFNKTSPANASNALPGLTLRWGASAGATAFRYCLDADTDTTCNTGWHDVGLNTNVVLTGQALGPHSWQVQATNGSGTTDANSNTWWTFTVVASQKIFLPFINKQLPPPGAFNKISPGNGAGGQPLDALGLSWNASTGATAYEFCLDTVNNSTCETSWQSASSLTSWPVGNLTGNTTYYWQVRAYNDGGYTYANNGVWWSFITLTPCANPKPGFWESATGDEFYVSTSCNQVHHFAIYVNIEGCGDYKITYPNEVAISSGHFSYNSDFYFSGTFDSATQVHGTNELNNFYIAGCGTVVGGPWNYTASWQSTSQGSSGSSQNALIATLVAPDDMPANFHRAQVR